MTIKRLILSVLTLLAIALMGLSLLESWNQPQIQSRLELYQTNLILQASEWQGPPGTNLQAAQNTLLGAEPKETAFKQYEEARESILTNLKKAQDELGDLSKVPTDASEPQTGQAPIVKVAPPAQKQRLEKTVTQLQTLRDELDLRLGLLQVEQGNLKTAQQTWQDLISRLSQENNSGAIEDLARVVLGLWSEPPQIFPNAEAKLQTLPGWFRYQSLTRLYQLQERQSTLTTLQEQEQAIAEQAFWKLTLLGGIPTFGIISGTGLLIFLVGQRIVKGKQSLLAENPALAWSTPWNGEIVWQVFIIGFFVMGQLLVPYLFLPTLFKLVQVNPATLTERGRAFSILASYLLLAGGGLSVLYFSIKEFRPLPPDWFKLNLRGRWFLWGLGGYLVALPLVVVVSLLNQQLWQGQGGSNPILPIALDEQDPVALGIFVFTASIAAPFYEELMFRGFLLPSLTRYVPVWGAIAASAFLFAVAHLSLSEVLPLMTLGIILGFVYTRSRNLLASMLLHCLWNSGTLLSLFLLGSSSN